MAEPATPVEITVTIRYFAAARAAAGVPEEDLSVPAVGQGQPQAAAEGISVATVLEAAIGRHGDKLATVVRRCSFLLDEVAVHGTDTPMRAGQVLDVLPPFAGG